eukprot:GILK01004432.1.p1 GENE.GILK01004432.1~~GILK01004432.1.p1  ORF type:complete len:534 (+),score=93.84 GILK01004432.1:25-1602(+)
MDDFLDLDDDTTSRPPAADASVYTLANDAEFDDLLGTNEFVPVASTTPAAELTFVSTSPTFDAPNTTEEDSATPVSDTSVASLPHVSPHAAAPREKAEDFVDLALSRHEAASATKEPADATPLASITVSDPVKQGEGLQAYITYKITSRIPDYQNPDHINTFNVVRRYRDFEWLHAELGEKFPGIIIPPLPEKIIVGRFSPEFVESRRRMLDRFLTRIAHHEDLRYSADLKNFLEAKDSAFETYKDSIMRRRKDSRGFMSVLNAFSQTVTNTLSGSRERSKTQVDLQFDEMETYLTNLETQLINVHRNAEKLVARLSDTAGGLFEFGLASTLLGQCESNGVGSSLNRLGSTADRLSVTCHEEVERETLYFEEPLKDYIRIVGAVKDALKTRTTALTALSAAEHNLDAKRTKSAKLAMQGGKNMQDKQKQAEREVEDADRRVAECRLSLERITKSLTREMQRFKEEKEKDIQQLLVDYVNMQLEHAKKVQAAWQALLSEVTTPPVSTTAVSGSRHRRPTETHSPTA